MSWFKVVVGFVIMIAVLVGWVRLMSRVKGNAGAPASGPVRKGRGRTGGGNELEQFIAAHRTGAARAAAQAESPSVTPDAVPAQAAAPVPAHQPAAALEGPLRLTYLLVRATYPDLLAFPNFSAARLPGLAPGATARDRVFDLVLCRPDFTPVAVIVLREGSMPGTSPEAQILGPAIRCIELDPRQLPRREQLKRWLALP